MHEHRLGINPVRRGILLLLFLLCFGAGQDSHYWNSHYGTSAELLSGLVVGSIKDLSSVYYNPGAITLTRDQSLVINTNGFNFAVTNFQKGGERGKDILSVTSGIAPGIFAIRLTDSDNKNQFAISYLTRYDYKLKAYSENIDLYEKSRETPYSSRSNNIGSSLFEGWGGFTWATNIAPNFGFGLTQYIAVRNQERFIDGGSQDLSPEGLSSVFNYSQRHSYLNVRTLIKIGAVFDNKPWKIGLNITSPSLDLFGFSTVYYNVFLNGFENENIPDFMSSFADKNGTSTYKSPFSIALGFSYDFDEVIFHFTTEWFSSLDQYSVIPDVHFKSQSNGNDVLLQFNEQAKSILNVGIGYQYQLYPDLIFFGALITDRSYRSGYKTSGMGISNWDIYHLSAGSKFAIDQYEFTLGLNFGYGKDNIDFPLFTNGISQPGEALNLPSLDVSYFSINVVFGISLN